VTTGDSNQPFYRWQKEFFENGAAAFQQRGRTNHQPEQERIAYLEQKIQTKDVIEGHIVSDSELFQFLENRNVTVDEMLELARDLRTK
jgi:transposase